MKLSIIFETEPNIGWGSRGNPGFWNHLKSQSANMEMFVTGEELEEWIKDEYLKVTGERLTEDSTVYVKDYDEGGMSAGQVYGAWWIHSGIPLLQKRIEQCNS